MIEITINNVDRTTMVEVDSITFTSRVSGRSSAAFTLHSPAGSNRPVRGQSIGIFYNTNRIWSGLIQDFEEFCLVQGGGTLSQHEFRINGVSLEASFDRRLVGPATYGKTVFTAQATGDTITAPGHGLQNDYIVQLVSSGTLPGGLSSGVDYHVISVAGNTFQLSLTSGGAAIDITDAGTGTHYFWWTTGSIARDLVRAYANGDNITTSTTSVQVGIPVERRIYNYETLTSAIEELAQTSEYVWYIDADFALNFAPRSATPAPFNITSSTAIRNISLTRTGENYANVIRHRIAWEAFADSSNTFIGDGSTRVWALSGLAEQIVSVTLNDETVSFGVEGVDAAPYLWNPGQSRFVQDSGEPVLTGSDTLVVTYRTLGANVITADNAAEIASQAAIEGNSGRYEALFDSPDTSAASGASRAAALLDSHDQQEVIVTYESDTQLISTLYQLAAGQIQTVNLAAMSINQTLLLDEVTFQGTNQFHMQATVRAISSDRFLGAVAFFKALGGGGGGGGGTVVGGVGTSGSTTIVEEHTLTAPTTNIVGPSPVDGSILIEVYTQDATGGRAITLGSNFYSGSGVNLNPAPLSVTLFTYIGRDNKWWPSSPSISF